MTNSSLWMGALAAVCLAACQGTSAPAQSGTNTPSPDPPGPDTPGPDTPTPPPPVVLGYYTGSNVSRDAMTAFYASLNMVSADVYGVSSSGDIVGGDDALPEIINFNRTNGIRTLACVANFGTDGFDSDLARAAIVTYKDKVIDQLVELARVNGFDGINIDFEAIYPDDRDAFSQFNADLAQALHAAALKLVISAPAKQRDNPNSDWSWPFDYAALGQSVDLIQLMTYDQHGLWDRNTGSIAGLDWMESCVQYAASVVDPEKLLIGLPAYGRDWDLTDGTYDDTFYWKEVPAFIAAIGATLQWDAASQSAFVNYTDSHSHSHEAWYETPEGITAKVKLVKKYGLGGVSMWSLGQEDADFWSAVVAGLQ